MSDEARRDERSMLSLEPEAKPPSEFMVTQKKSSTKPKSLRISLHATIPQL
jgi:hypothetical protein